METEINFKSLKTLEEVNKYINQLKNSYVSKWYIESIYGSFENFEKEFIRGWEQHVKSNEEDKLYKLIHDEEYQKQEIEKRKKIYENYMSNWQNQLMVKKDYNKDNMGKKCKIFKHKHIKDGTEGIIKDLVELTQQYVINIDSDIVYVNFENVDVIEEWKDITLEGHDKDLKDYDITIKQNKIIVKSYTDDIYTYELDFDKNIQEKLIHNLDKNRDKVIECILIKTKAIKLKKEHEKACEDVLKAREKRYKLANNYHKTCDNINSLLEGLV